MPKHHLIIALLACGFLGSCKDKPETAASTSQAAEAELVFISETRPLMGTEFTVSVYAKNKLAATAAIDNAFDIAKEINQAASDYDAESELSQLNRAPHGEPISISPILAELLTESLAAAKLTNGAYDPTLGPLTRLWRQSRRSKSLPTADAIAEAKAACGYQNLVLSEDRSTVTKQVPNMRLDLGGIAKGFTAERMYQVFLHHEIPICSIAAGGDLRVGDPPPGEDGWPLKIRHRHGQEQDIIGFKQAAASTSGDLYQAVEIDGKRYAHLIDPKTGLGLTRPVSITVFAKSAVITDPLATALCVLPEAEAKAVAARFPKIEVHSSYSAEYSNDAEN